MQERRSWVRMNGDSFGVDLGGMIKLLSEHLYSTPKVFLRELLQNAADAIVRRQQLDGGFRSAQIDITVEKDRSVSFLDNGCGLTEEELRSFVSVIGKSSKDGEDTSFIGRFGIGLLSCFTVTDEIVLRTRSAACPDKVLEWHGYSDGRYSITEIESDMPVGTEVFIRSDKGFGELFTAEGAAKVIGYYGLPIPYPVYVKTGDVKIRANALPVMTGGSGRKQTLEMGRKIFGTSYDFVDFIPLESPTGLFSGVAYILPFTVSAASGLSHRIYLKNMLLTENGSSILPEWAFFVRCFFNTDKLRPTASREDFYKDELLEKAREEISLCISAYLERLSVSDTGLLAKIVSLHGTALRSVCAENENMFGIFMPYFDFETDFGVISGNALSEYGKTVFYTSQADLFRQLRPVFAEKGQMLINTAYVHDKALLDMFSSLGYFNIEPVSDGLLESLLEDDGEPERFDFLIDVFSEALEEFGCRAVLKGFAPSQLAAIYSFNSDAELMRDIKNSKEKSYKMFEEMLDAFEEETKESASAVLYINSRNPLINRLAGVDDREKAETFCKILYVQSLIAGGFPIRSGEMNLMNENLIRLIEWGI